jgi:hypothetical protein
MMIWTLIKDKDLTPLHSRILETFDAGIRTVFEKIEANESESALLGSIRDSLLPRLMSGKIRVTIAK